MRHLLPAICFLLLFGSCKTEDKADLVLINGLVYTVDTAFSTTEAFVVKGGKIIAMGTSQDMLKSYPAKDTIDAHGKPVYPGFIDAHAHFVGYGRSLYEVGLYDCKTWAEAVERVKNFVAQHPNETGWIRGRGWDQNKWPGKAFPDNTMLNQLFPDRPVLLERIDGHAAVANNKALSLAGITPATTIAGGSIEQKNGVLTGTLVDNAVDLVSKIIPKPTQAEYEKWLSTAQRNCFEQGLTTITDCGLMYYDVAIIDTLQRQNKLHMRLYVMLSDDPENYKRFIGNKPYKTDRLYVKGVKAYADGALGSRGACLCAPYFDKPGWTGFLLYPATHYDSIAQMLAKTEYQLCTHAIGDSGNRVVLGVYNKYLAGKNDKRWRIEHAQVVCPEDFNLFGKASIIPSVQPTHATSDMYWAGERLGLPRLKGAYAYKQLLEQNGWLPLGTDFPVEDISPFKTFYAATERRDAKGYPPGGFQTENALTREQALRGMTIWAAKAGFLDQELGSLEPGKNADFIILSDDLMHTPAANIVGTKVVATYVAGIKVYGAK